MSATRTLTARLDGPVFLAVAMPTGSITITAEPDRRRAELTLSTTSDDRALVDAVRTAALVDGGDLITVTVPEISGGTAQVIQRGGGTTVVQNIGVVRGSVTGVVISGDGALHISGGRMVSGSDWVAVGSIDLEVKVPEGCSIEVETTSADVDAPGEHKAIRFRSVSGDLAVGGVGSLTARTTSGDVRADAVDGLANIRTISGDVRLARADAIEAESTSGRLSVADFGGTAQMTTVSGDIDMHVTEGGQITARSTSGDVFVTASLGALTEGLRVDARSMTGTVTTPEQDAHSTRGTRPRRPRRSTGATAHAEPVCLEHGDTWACGCDGCETALRTRGGAR